MSKIFPLSKYVTPKDLYKDKAELEKRRFSSSYYENIVKYLSEQDWFQQEFLYWEFNKPDCLVKRDEAFMETVCSHIEKQKGFGK